MTITIFVAGAIFPMASEAARMGRVRSLMRERERARKLERERAAEAALRTAAASPAPPRSSPAEQLARKRLRAEARKAEAERVRRAFAEKANGLNLLEELGLPDAVAGGFAAAAMLQRAPDPSLLRAFIKGVSRLDPSGRLPCAFAALIRDQVDVVLARKAAGLSDEEVFAKAERDFLDWCAKGQSKIIHEFEGVWK